MIKASLKQLGRNKLLDYIQRLVLASDKCRLYVGVPEGTSRKSDDELGNADLAYIHEYGAPNAGIPPRPFLEHGIKSGQDKASKVITNALLRGKGYETAYNLAGMVLVSSVKKTLTDGMEPPLAPGTIRARRKKGFKGTNPLIRTGQLLNSLHYIVKK